MVSGLRTSAVTLWLRCRSSEMTSLPVRPLPPMIKTRLLESIFCGDCPSSFVGNVVVMVCACEFECVQCFFLVDQEEDCCEDVDAGVC